MKIRLKTADMGGMNPQYSPVNTQLAPIAPPMGSVPNMAETMSMGFLQGSNQPTASMQPQQQGAQQSGAQTVGGQAINWNHVLASYVAQNLTSAAVSRFSPNSQQNATQQFNKQKYSPLNFLPYTSNNSLQDRYGVPSQGMKKGGMVGGMGAWPPRAEDGGTFGSSDMSDMMRKWILDDQAEAPPAPTQEEAVQQPKQDDGYNEAMQFAMFTQMFGQDAADAEKEPEDNQGFMFKKGGMKKMPIGGTITPGNVAAAKASGWDDTGLIDNINKVLASGAGAKGSALLGYNDDQKNLLTSAYLYAQQNKGKVPTDTINSFFNRPIDPNNSTDVLRQRLGKIGYGADAMYNASPDQDINQTLAEGGPVTDGELYSILGDEATDEHMDYLKKGGWIQKANASIKRRGTKGVCTGSKFGGPSCRPGTRRYALAKTFKHMAHNRKHKKEEGGLITYEDGGTYDMSPETIIGLIGQGYDFDV